MQPTSISPEALNAVSILNSLYTELTHNRRPLVDEWDRAYLGEHKFTFASTRFGEYVKQRYAGFSDNWCAVVADSVNERTTIQGISLDENGDEMSTEERLLWDDWLRNGMDEQSAQGFLETYTGSRSFVLVWGDPETQEPVATWEHPGQAIVGYDPENRQRRIAGLKLWSDESNEYATLYLPDVVWKFQRRLTTSSKLIVPQSIEIGGWLPRETANEPWPMENPLGVVPLVEFPNRPLLGKDPVSEIKGPLAIQKAINLLWLYALNAADYATLPQRVVMGAEPPKIPILDDEGNVVGTKPIPMDVLHESKIMWLTGQNGKIGEWSPQDLAIFTEPIEVLVGHLAAQTRTPQHYLIGKMANLSGDALIAAETGLVKKTTQALQFMSRPAREVFALMAMVRDRADLATKVRVGQIQWADPQFRALSQQVDAMQKLHSMGWPLSDIARQLGRTPSEWAQISEQIAIEGSQKPSVTDAQKSGEQPTGINGGTDDGAGSATSS